MFTSLERIVREGLRESLKGRDMTFRQFGADDEKNGEEEEVEGKAKKAAWVSFANLYSCQFNRMSEEFEKHQKCHAKDSIEFFYANQIKNWLLNTSDILRKTKSIGDLDSGFDSNKCS